MNDTPLILRNNGLDLTWIASCQHPHCGLTLYRPYEALAYLLQELGDHYAEHIRDEAATG